MDPTSAIIGFIGTGYKIIKFVRKTLKDVRTAPEQLQALTNSATDIEGWFTELQTAVNEGVFSQQDMERLERWERDGTVCLCKIEKFMKTVERVDDGGQKKIHMFAWLRKKSKVTEFTKDMDKLHSSVQSIFMLANSRRNQRLSMFIRAIGVDVQDVRTTQLQTTARIEEVGLSVSAVRTRIPSSTREETYVSCKSCCLSHAMHCDDGCACRCHSTNSKQVVPATFTSYIGRLNVSQQLLDDIRWSPLDCNVRTCRRCRTGPPRITVYLPPALGFFDIPHISLGRLPFCMSIHAPRVVPDTVKVWRTIVFSDLDGLRALFEAREATVYDVNPEGDTLLRWACQIWAFNRTEASLQVIKFLADAGANPEFSAGKFSVKIYLFDSSLNILHEHPAGSFAHQVKASSVAIDICHTLGLDIDDVIEEGLISRRVSEGTVKLLTLTPSAVDNSSSPDTTAVWQEIRYNRLQHAILYSPLRVTLQLLEQGEDASTFPSLALAAWRDFPDLIKPLLDAGAHVNHYDEEGMTALHYTGRGLHLRFLQTLTELAEDDIDWLARTRDGQTALQLVQESRYLNDVTQDELDAISCILRAHIPDDELELDDGYVEMPGAFPTCAPPPALH